MFEHKSDALLDSRGKFSSACLNMIGICGTNASSIVMPDSSNPTPIRTKLFGNIKLGPIKKFEIPHVNNPKANKFISLKHFPKHGISVAIKTEPVATPQNNKLWIKTESVN